MSDRPQNYPDSTGSRWDAATGRRPAANDRPAFMDRTEPMTQQGRPGAGDNASLDDLMGSGGQTSKIPAQQSPVREPVAQWPAESEPATAAPGGFGGADQGDPELAAAAGHSAPPRPPVQGQVDPNTGAVPGPYQAPAAPQPPAVSPAMAQPVTGNFDGPTQLHNPVPGPEARETQPARRGQAASVGDGVYRRTRPGLGIVVAIAALVMAGLVVFMLISAIKADGPVAPSAIMSGAFALAGLPMTAWGLYPLLGMGPNSGPDDLRAILRPPYAFLLTGLVLLVAAGLAA